MAVTETKILSGFSFAIKTKNFTILSDVPENEGGQNSAPSPHDYIEVALASCTATTLQMYAQRKSYPLDYAEVQVDIQSEGSPNEIIRRIKLIGNISSEQCQRLLEIANKCPIHKFLSANSKITTELI